MTKGRSGRVNPVWYLFTLALAAGACAPEPETVPGTPAPPGSSDYSVIAGVFQTFNTAEVRSSELAATKASNAEVRAFAQTLVRDHNQANQRLARILADRDIQPQASSTSAEIHRAENQTYANLQTKTGSDFDRTYLDAEISHHRWIINQLDKNLIPKAQDAQVKDYLESIRATEAGHLQEAERLRGRMGG